MKLFPDTIFLLFLSAVFILTSCERSTSPLLPASLHFSAEYVAVTEADLRLQTDKLPENAVLEIRRGDSLIFRGALQTADTTVTDTALLPAHDYSYTATLFKNGKPAAYSQPMQITTMDTTSHDFTWEITQIPSPYGSGELRDVAIVSENDIWAVGEIYSDSANHWLPYNAVHWDGQRWKLKRIKTNACGGVDYPPIRTVFAFSENKILFGHIDESITYFDGVNFVNDCSFIQQINGSINKMWGTSREDLYVVGSNGLIAYYDGVQWQRIESGTQTMINDIYGITNNNENHVRILCAVGEVFNQGTDRALLSIQSDNIVSRFPWPSDVDVHSVWMNNSHRTYACGSNIWINTNKEWKRVKELPPKWWYRIRGSAANDIWACGDRGIFTHFNGKSWIFYQLADYGTRYYDLDIKNDLVIIAGFGLRNGYLITIRRNR